VLARWLRLYYLLQVLLGALLGQWLVLRLNAPEASAFRWWLPALSALGLPVLLQAIGIGISMWRALQFGGPERNWGLIWQAVFGEFLAAVRIFMGRMPWPASHRGVLACLGGNAPVQGRLPVLLVHGYLCNHRAWDDVAAALRAAGHPVLALDLEPVFGPIDDYAGLLQEAATRLLNETGAPRLAAVGHSMGGLVIRAWMRRHGHERVAQVITLGSPHQGTRIAEMSHTANGAQMVWHSAWVTALQGDEPPPVRALMHLAWSQHDNIVYPQHQQLLAGAQSTAFAGVGHLQMLLHPQVIAWLVAQLDADANAPQAAQRRAATTSGQGAAQHPRTLGQLFWAFTGLALQGFGGVLAVVQRELVEKKGWLSRERFMEDWAVAQVLPGPNVVNLSMMIGDRYFGLRGALVALAGMLAFPTLIVLGLAVALAGVADQPEMQGALRGLSAVAAGLIAATGLKLLPALKQNVLEAKVQYALIAITFVAIALLRVRLIWVLLGLGGLGALWAYRLLGKEGTGAA